jgi:argininosuccinate lyase
MPLGSGALAGSTFPLNRERVAELLGFSRISENSLDAVSDRDYILDALYACAVAIGHMSRLCEELVLWSSIEFHFVEISDAYATGSSMMPQKKNPDAAELIRGKTGRVYGDLIALMTTMKGLPLAYDKDMQEDKEPLFDAADTICACAPILERMLATARFNTEDMSRAASGGFTNATDAADYLAGKGVPFRDAHSIVGRLVRYCAARNIAITDVPLEELRGYSEAFDDDVYGALSIEQCVARRNLPGGPAPHAVKRSIKAARERLDKLIKVYN